MCLKRSLFILLLIYFNSGYSQIPDSSFLNFKNYFVKYEVTPGRYKIIPLLDTVFSNTNHYDLRFKEVNTFEDTLALLKSLLSFENDTSRCALRPANYNSYSPLTSSSPVNNDSAYSYYTIAVDALIIFNEIIAPEPFYLQSFPRLRTIGNRKGFSIYDERIHEVYAYYRSWLKRCIRLGRFDISKPPLYKTNYWWF